TGPVLSMFIQTVLFVIVIKLVLSYPFGLLRGWWRYTGISDLLDLTRMALVSSLLIYCVSLYVLSSARYLLSIVILDFAFTILIMGGARFAVRAYTEAASSMAAGKKRTL